MRPESLPPPESFASRPHGTRARYVGGGCRCAACRSANSAYEKRARRLRLTGRGNPLVPARRAREHIRRLSLSGVGRKAVSVHSGVPNSTLHKILDGTRAQIRRATEKRILAVEGGDQLDGALCPGDLARKQVRYLQRQEGYTLAELTKLLGLGSVTAPQFLYRGGPIRVATARAVQELYERAIGDAHRGPVRG